MSSSHDTSSLSGLDPFYPIVGDAGWVRRLVAGGTRCIQLRVKGKPSPSVKREIDASLQITKPAQCTLIVNDHWREAIVAGADYVHLGQEDLDIADIAELKRRRIRIGISTHSDAELKRAMALAPDYIALGPIYPTQSKVTGHDAQGLDRIAEWKRRVGEVPLVAIGGVTLERASEVVLRGAQSVAIISDVTAAKDPDRRIAEWVAWSKA